MRAMDTGFANMTPEQWQKYLRDNETSFQRQSDLRSLQQRYFGGENSTFGAVLGGGTGSSSNSTSTNTSSSLFGGLGVGDWGSYVDQAKDLARFRLGLDQEQARFSRGLREEESQADFGRNYKLADQQITGQKDLTNIQQSATTDRLQRQLTNQREMQEAGFGQQNLYRAQSAALALRGLR